MIDIVELRKAAEALQECIAHQKETGLYYFDHGDVEEAYLDIVENPKDILLLLSELETYKAALERLSTLGNGDVLGNSECNRIAQRALFEWHNAEGDDDEL